MNNKEMEQDETRRKSSPHTARELFRELGYANWQNSVNVIKKAMIMCRMAGHNVEDHFTDVSKMVCIGSGAQRMVRDYDLSPYACYLIARCADHRKESVQSALGYFEGMVYGKAEVEEEHPTPAHAASHQVQNTLPVLLFLHGEKGDKCLIIHKIAWIEADRSYVHFHMKDGRKEIARCSLKNVLQQLNDRGIDFFVRIHNSYATNIYHIERKMGHNIYVGNDILMVSRRYREGFSKHYIDIKSTPEIPTILLKKCHWEHDFCHFRQMPYLCTINVDKGASRKACNRVGKDNT